MAILHDRIPFERALDFANKEKITELLYPLFVHNIGAFLYHPTNTHRTNAVMAAAERRRADSSVLTQSQALNQGQLQRRATTDMIPSSQAPQMHHQGMHTPMHHQSLPPNLSQPRPELQRSMSFPTPPSSASSVMGGGPDSSFWSGNMVSQGNGGPLAIDTVMNSRSMPTTPATTPPGGIQQLQQYPPPPSSLYPSQQANMGQQNIAQQNMQRFNQPLPQPSQYMSQSRDQNNMGPPTSRGPPPTLSRPASRQDDGHGHGKDEGAEEQNGLPTEGEDHGVQGIHEEESTENEAEHHQEEYTTHENSYPNGHRSVYYPPLQTEHTPQLSPEMNGSPGQGPSTPARPTYGAPNASVPRTVDGGSGATPRTTTTPQQQWVQNGSGYSTPPRSNSASGNAIRQPPQRNVYQLVGGDAPADQSDPSVAPGAPDGTYATQGGIGVPMPSQTPPQSYGVNGITTPSSSSNKRVRDMDDDEEHNSRPSSRDHDDRAGGDAEAAIGGMKRRKTVGREGAPTVAPAAGMAAGSFDRSADGRLSRTRPAVNTGRVGGRR